MTTLPSSLKIYIKEQNPTSNEFDSGFSK